MVKINLQPHIAGLVRLRVLAVTAMVGAMMYGAISNALAQADLADQIAKADLGAGSMLDGEGGFTIYGGVRPAAMSVANHYLPLGLANHVKLVRPVKKDQPITLDDVEIETTSTAYKLREKTIAMLAR